ncbi:hypothetical protein F4801DRAFT_549870 [Xylaria longipes]|nr:hypothetical protein F4801DRAFT_549870 [Xylaria longipes]RYC58158.1 hypothetical protein CHU98_g8053 [Xylaria longipes]
MTKSLERGIESEGEVSCLQVMVENEEWPNLQPVLSFSSSEYAQTQLSLPSLPLPRREGVIKGIDTCKDINARLPNSAFDRSKVIDACCDELDVTSPLSTDYCQIKTTQEILHGKQVCVNAECINLQPGGSYENGEDCYTDVSGEGEYHNPASRISGGQDLLEELDDLEAARPKPEKRRVVIPGNREGIWEALDFGAVESSFDSWVDEVAALEASASMPKGTRYYKVRDLRDSTI